MQAKAMAAGDASQHLNGVSIIQGRLFPLIVSLIAEAWHAHKSMTVRTNAVNREIGAHEACFLGYKINLASNAMHSGHIDSHKVEASTISLKSFLTI